MKKKKFFPLSVYFEAEKDDISSDLPISMGHAEGEFFISFCQRWKIAFKKSFNLIPSKDIMAHNISYNFLYHLFYYLRRLFIGCISS